LDRDVPASSASARPGSHRRRVETGLAEILRKLLSMLEGPPRQAVVIRFTPVKAESILERAKKDARRPEGKGHHTASVWADVEHTDETRDDLIHRLLELTELHGLITEKNPRYWVCTSAGELYDLNFKFEKDGYPGEPDEHYSVVLGNPPDLADAERFLSVFRKEER